jgi:hypothetical protein
MVECSETGRRAVLRVGVGVIEGRNTIILPEELSMVIVDIHRYAIIPFAIVISVARHT